MVRRRFGDGVTAIVRRLRVGVYGFFIVPNYATAVAVAPQVCSRVLPAHLLPPSLIKNAEQQRVVFYDSTSRRR